MKIIDLRSDTVTKPTPEMREAMAKAEVGDDVYGEDPTVNRLQEMASEQMGKEAGLFVPSGTMGNLAAVLAHCNRGDEVILGHLAHTFLFEGGGVAAFGGVHPYVLQNRKDGTIEPGEIQNAIRSDDPHFPVSRLIVLENTHNRCGGVALPQGYTDEIRKIAQANSLKMHLDGARIFNASIALNVSASDLAKPFDSVTFCLSKGLCAPVGSVLCGSKDFIRTARRIRKGLGGGMRQAGVLAAAGIVALEKMVGKLAEDHKKAKELAKGLSGIAGLQVDYGEASTNMVFVSLRETISASNKDISAKLKEKGILVGAVEGRRLRMVVHYWITDEDISQVIEAYHRLFA